MTEHNHQQKLATSVGRRGEDLAALYLEQNGFRILARNYCYAHCEIDIIATDGSVLIFTEVKTRGAAADPAGVLLLTRRPSAAVTKAKQKNIEKAATAYVRDNKPQGVRMRFDVIEIYLRHGSMGNDASDILKLHHIRNAFTVSHNK